MPIKTLLLIDDDSDDHAIFGMALAEISESITLVESYDGEDALQKLSGSVTAPDIIFLDINMPIMNGFETLKHLKASKSLKHIPVVIYSTSNEPHYQSQAVALGAVDYIKKPSSFGELHQYLSSFLHSFSRE